MLDTKTLPTIMIVLSLLSAAHHACVNPTDWRHIGYWLLLPVSTTALPTEVCMASPKASGRMINRDISESDGVASLSPEAAVLFMMLIPHYNSHGKMFASPGHIKDLAVPKIPYLTYENISQYLQEISDKTSVKWFKLGAKWWLHSLKFLSDHQHLREDKLGKDDLPDYDDSTSTGVVPDLPFARKLEVRSLEEKPLYDDASSQASTTPLPPTEDSEASSSLMSINEFRFLFQEATGCLMPGGCNHRACELCRLYPREKIKNAFEITALQGGKTLKYVESVLEGKPKPEPRGRDRPNEVTAVLTENDRVCSVFCGDDEEKRMFCEVMIRMAKRLKSRGGLPQELTDDLLMDWFESLHPLGFERIAWGARHLIENQVFYPSLSEFRIAVFKAPRSVVQGERQAHVGLQRAENGAQALADILASLDKAAGYEQAESLRVSV